MPIFAFGYGAPHEITILALILLFMALPTVFWIIELVDAARRRFPEPSVKIVWLFVIFFFPILGALVYYLVGKKQGILADTQTNHV